MMSIYTGITQIHAKRVNNIWNSTYTNYSHNFQHWALPVVNAARIFFDNGTSPTWSFPTYKDLTCKQAIQPKITQQNIDIN